MKKYHRLPLMTLVNTHFQQVCFQGSCAYHSILRARAYQKKFGKITGRQERAKERAAHQKREMRQYRRQCRAECPVVIIIGATYKSK